MADSYATRVSKQIDQMMRERALKNQQEREAKAAEQIQKQAQLPQPQAQSQVQPSGGYGGAGDKYRMQEIEKQTNG